MSNVATKDAIINLALGKQIENIRKEFTTDELADMKDSVATNCIKLSELEEEFQETKDAFRAKMDPLKKANKDLLQNIKLGFEDKDMLVYCVPDYDNRIMELYNDEGTKVGERRLMMSEMQGRLEMR